MEDLGIDMRRRNNQESQAESRIRTLIVTRRVLESLGGAPRDPEEFDFEADIRGIPEGPQCFDCSRPWDDEERQEDPQRAYLEFGTYAELQIHRNIKHGRLRDRTKSFDPPAPMGIQIGLNYVDIPYRDASDEAIGIWENDLRDYLNTIPTRRIAYDLNNHTKNLLPIDGE